jgi:hypothetical protein
MDDAARYRVPPPPRAPRPARRIAAISLTVLVAAALLDAGWNAVAYHVLPGPATIGGIHWCGRDYRTLRTAAEIRAMAPRPVQNVGHYVPLNVFGAELYASVTPDAKRHTASPPLPCSEGLYLRTAQGRYLSYALSGGP